MRTLRESRLIEIIREEYDNVINALLEDIDTRIALNGHNVDVIDVGLRVKHEESGVLYTVVNDNAGSIVLKAPDGKNVAVTRDKLESDFSLRWDNDKQEA